MDFAKKETVDDLFVLRRMEEHREKEKSLYMYFVVHALEKA